MKKNIIFNITKHVRVDESPFGIVIYIYKDRNTILVEDMVTGKCIQASSYDISKYLKLDNIQTEWKRSFDHSYTRMQNSNVEYFMPLYMETNRFATLSFDIINRMRPEFRTKRVLDPSDHRGIGREINMINNEEAISGSYESGLKTYNELYENIKDFETDNFTLEMVENDKEKIYDEYFNKIKSPHITCKLPMFQIYSILIPNIDEFRENSIRFGYRQELTVIKIKDRFYRFPYGNISSNDHICLGNYGSLTKNQPDSIQDAAYAGMVTSVFNGDYMPNVKFNNQVPSCFDINVLREKVKNDDFAFSFMDALFYLSQCESIDDINLNMFIRTPSIPKTILDFERKLLNKSDNENEDEIDESLWYRETATDTQPGGPEPIRNPEAGYVRGNIRIPEFAVPVREYNTFDVRDELREIHLNYNTNDIRIQLPPVQEYNPLRNELREETNQLGDVFQENNPSNIPIRLNSNQIRLLQAAEASSVHHQINVNWEAAAPNPHHNVLPSLGLIRTDIPLPQDIITVDNVTHYDRPIYTHSIVENVSQETNITLNNCDEPREQVNRSLDIIDDIESELQTRVQANHDRRTIDLIEGLAGPINNTGGEENEG